MEGKCFNKFYPKPNKPPHAWQLGDTTRLKLLSTVRESISQYVAETIYCAMIEPVLMYCSAVLLGDERQCCHKLQNLQERANKIVFGKKARNTWIPLKYRREIDAAIVIFKRLHVLSPLTPCFGFSLLNHGKNTRENGLNLVLLKVKTQSGKKTFAFQGVKLYNNLIRELKKNDQCYFLNQNLNFIYL